MQIFLKYMIKIDRKLSYQIFLLKFKVQIIQNSWLLFSKNMKS